MRVLVQINGPGPCPAWTALAADYKLETVWMTDPAQAVAVAPDLVIIQHVTQTHDLLRLGWEQLRCPVIGVCGDAAVITNLEAVFHNLPVLTRLYVDGYDYFEHYEAWCRRTKQPHYPEKLIYQKFCADTLFPPLSLPKEFDWTFIGQIYAAYDQRLKHTRNEFITQLYQCNPNGFVSGSAQWQELLGLAGPTGWLPQTALNAYYAKSHVVVSVDAHDGTGYTSTRPIEAMHAGHCVVMFDHDGMAYFKQFVVDGEHAFYVRTVAELLAKVELVKSQPQVAQQMGRAARAVMLAQNWTHSGWLRRLIHDFLVTA